MNTHRLYRAASLSALALSLVASAKAQGGPSWDICIPNVMMPVLHSEDYRFGSVQNQLFGVSVGTSGTTMYGNADPIGNCFAEMITGNASGRFCFFNGPIGSVQTTFDDGMALTFGAPSSPGGSWGYANVIQGAVGANTDSTLFGINGFDLFFTGASDTYTFGRTTNGGVRSSVRWDLVGDACRVQWDMQNISGAPLRVGLNVGHWVALLANTGEIRGGYRPDTSVTPPPIVDVPGFRPISTERRFTRSTDPNGFPSEISYLFDQQRPYGLRVNNSQTTATIDAGDTNQSLTNADEVVTGSSFFLLGEYGANDVNAFPDFIFGDPISDVRPNDTAYIQKYYPTTVATGGTRTIIQFYNSPWSDASYGRPYSVVVDKPRVLNLAAGSATAFEQSSYTLRVYIDNNRGFSTVDRELPLEDVNVTLTLGSGLNVVGPATRTISRVDARRIGFVDFPFSPDAAVSGDINYTVNVNSSPGGAKSVSGTIRATAQPRLPVFSGANLVTSPYNFTNPVWEEILAPLTPDADYQVFAWDPEQSAYVIQTGPERGRGSWIVSRADRGIVTLNSEPSSPTDQFDPGDGSGGAPLVTLRQGWNLIGNPYPIAIPLNQIVGSSNASSSQSLTFNELVQAGFISGSLAFWDNPNQTYRYIQADATGRLEPQRGYWIFVFTEQDVILRYPPVYQPGYRSTTEKPIAWTQSEKQWRLQLAARTPLTADDQNFIGLAKTAAVAKSTQWVEAPMAPVKGAVSVSVDTEVDGKSRSLAQSLVSGGDRQTFKVKVESRDAGPVTLTWPNLSTIPKNVRARMVDKATGETRDLRKFSGYTFTAESRSIRNLEISVEPGFANRVVIGNIVATRDTRAQGNNAPFTINYTLATDATTSVRILGANGREVYTATRGRADKAGSNSIVWNLRDNANRAVAPGTYRVEVVAEGDSGERVRKFYPLNLVR